MKTIFALLGILSLAVLLMADDCDTQDKPQSDSGVHKASVQVATGSNGLTTEQTNVRDRLIEDNKPGAIKHLYVISPFSGQCILYSTVKGKVTSSGKRLSPTNVTVVGTGNGYLTGYDFQGHTTGEVLQDDGTYGSSGDYLYWWDVRGIYHQLYGVGSSTIIITDQPIPLKSITINLEELRATH